MTDKSPRDSQVEMTEMVLPQHTNALGTIFGGIVMSWVDIAAATCAMRHARKSVVTASVDSLHFLAPIRLGWIVTLKASVNHVFSTSCEVGVKITSENLLTGESFHNASAYLTFVALNSHGKPTPLPQIRMETAEDRKRAADAQARRKARLELKEKLSARQQTP